jgi:hypothetical protein
MFCKIVARGTDGLSSSGESRDLTGPLDRSAAQELLTRIVLERRGEPTSKGWLCHESDGSMSLFTLERCGDKSAQSPLQDRGAGRPAVR